MTQASGFDPEHIYLGTKEGYFLGEQPPQKPDFGFDMNFKRNHRRHIVQGNEDNAQLTFVDFFSSFQICIYQISQDSKSLVYCS